MSNPPSTPNKDVDDFSFPIIVDPNNNNGVDCVASPSILDYHELRALLDDDPQEDEVALLPSTHFITNWGLHPHHHAGESSTSGSRPIDSNHHHHHHPHHHGGQSSTSGSRPIDSNHHHQHQVGGEVGQGQGGSNTNKKLAHNAKERVRRRNLNATYLALRSMLPHSKRPKEKWSAPYIIDRTLEYIPKLQAEVDNLSLEKTNILSVIGKKQVLSRDDQGEDDDKQQISPTVSLNQVKKGHIIIQICQQITDKSNDFSSLIESLEGQGIQIVGASSVFACKDRFCFHLHLQIGEIEDEEGDYIQDLHNKVIAHFS